MVASKRVDFGLAGKKEREEGSKYRPGNWVTLTEGIAFATPFSHPVSLPCTALQPPFGIRRRRHCRFDTALSFT